MQLKFEKQVIKTTDCPNVSVRVCPFWVRDKLRDNGLLDSDWFNKDIDNLFSMEDIYLTEFLYYLFIDLLYFYCMNKNKFTNKRTALDIMHHDPLLNLGSDLVNLVKPITSSDKYFDTYDRYIHNSLFTLDREGNYAPSVLDLNSKDGILLSEVITNLFLRFNNPIDTQIKEDSNFDHLLCNVIESSVLAPTYKESTEIQKTFYIEQLDEHNSVIYIEKNFFMPIIEKYKSILNTNNKDKSLMKNLFSPKLEQSFNRLELPYGLTPNSQRDLSLNNSNEYYSYISNYFTYINYTILHEVYRYESLPVVARTNEFANLVGSL